MGGMGQGRVLLPWLLKPEVAVEEGEKPPLTRAERRHRATRIKRLIQLGAKHFKHDTLAMWTTAAAAGTWSQIKKRGESVGVNLSEKI